MFTDKQGHSETHIFDNSGSTVSVLNSNGYATSSENTGLVINNSANAYTKNYITESSQQTEVGGGKVSITLYQTVQRVVQQAQAVR